MKTTTIGKIGAITAGAAMLGTAVAGALAGAAVSNDLTSSDVSMFFNGDMSPKVQLVVGEKAQASDGAAAGKIAAVIGNLAYSSTSKTETMQADVPEETATCEASSGEVIPGEESAEGEVVLSFSSSGVVGDLEQREMNCEIYDYAGSGHKLELVNLTEGGDSGSYCDAVNFRDGNTAFIETYTPESTLQSVSWSQCSTVAGTGVEPLREEEFDNEICTICYDYCDLALNQEAHLMSEWVDIDCENLLLEYNCDDEQLELEVEQDSLSYTVFTDDLLTDDILDEDDDLVGQAYLGKILLGQEEYYVEQISDDKITIVKGESLKGITTAAPASYTTPEGDEYQIKIVGAQTLEQSGVVDVTLEVTKPDSTKVQVTSGISGTPIVGDLKVKLQRGNAATNVITGESSFTADILVWYIPSEYAFEDDEKYTEEGVKDDDGIWTLDFNAGENVLVGGLDDLEENENLTTDEELPDDVEENDHYDGGYNEAENANDTSTTYGDTPVIRALRFDLNDDVDLAVGEKIQLPFNDGAYLLSDLKFGYEGLTDENFNALDDVDTTTIEIERDSADVYNRTEEPLSRETAVTIDYIDQWGDSMSVRIDGGPYEDGDSFFANGKVYRIDDIDPTADVDDGQNEGLGWIWNLTCNGSVTLELSVKDSGDWDDVADCVLVNMTQAQVDANNMTVVSVLEDVVADVEYTHAAACITGTTLYADYADDGTDPTLQIYSDIDGDNVIDLETGGNVDTEFDGEVWFSANDGIITIDGDSDSGSEREILVTMFNDTSNDVKTFVNVTTCEETCDEYAEGDDEDGSIISLDGSVITIDSTSVEEPEDADDVDLIGTVTIVVPQEQLRPTIFFGTSSTSNESEVSITDADVGSIVNIGGVDVTVDEFGVVGSVSAGTIVGEDGEATTISCGGGTTDVTVTYDATEVKSIGYSLVVVEGKQSSGKSLVLVGGPVVNSLTKEVVKEIKEGEQLIKKAGASKLVVAGYSAADTQAAADELVSWLKANVH